jgi:hypothetical protein
MSKELNQIQEMIESAEKLNERGNTSPASMYLQIATAKALLAIARQLHELTPLLRLPAIRQGGEQQGRKIALGAQAPKPQAPKTIQKDS